MKLFCSLALVALSVSAVCGLTCTQSKSWATSGSEPTGTYSPFTIGGFDACTDGTNPLFTLNSVTVAEDGADHDTSYSVTFKNDNAGPVTGLSITYNERIRLYTEGVNEAAPVDDHLFYNAGTAGETTNQIRAPIPDIDFAPSINGGGATFTLTLANFDSSRPGITSFGPGDLVIDTSFNPTATVGSKTFTNAYPNFAIFDDIDWIFKVRKTYQATGPAIANLALTSASYPTSGSVTATYTYDSIITGDPQFAGFQGQQFQVHGIPEEFFNLVSTPDFFVNSRFVYLSNGFCDYNDTECFTHPGTYIDQLSFVMDGAMVKIIAGTHKAGLTVSINSQSLVPGNRVRLPLGNESYVQVVSHREAIVYVDMFRFRVVNSDNFMNMHAQLTDSTILTVGAKKVVVTETDPAKVDKVLSTSYPEHLIHGLLGQTWRNVQYPHKRFIQGDATDYQVANLQSPNFVFSTYTKAFNSA